MEAFKETNKQNNVTSSEAKSLLSRKINETCLRIRMHRQKTKTAKTFDQVGMKVRIQRNISSMGQNISLNKIKKLGISIIHINFGTQL